MKSKREQTWDSLRDPEYRKQFIDEHVNVGVAFQIRSLRNRQVLTQAELAQALNVRQPLVSSWENPNYGKYTLSTLREMAKAFDVGLLVRFVSFSTLVDWTLELTPDKIAPPSFKEEQEHMTSMLRLNDTVHKQIVAIVDANQYQAYPVTPSVFTTSSGVGPILVGNATREGNSNA